MRNAALAVAGAQAAVCTVGMLLVDSTIVTVLDVATAHVIIGAGTIAALEWPYVRAEVRAAAEAALSSPHAPARQESGS